MTPRLKPLPQLDDLLAAEQAPADEPSDEEAAGAPVDESSDRYTAIADSVTRASQVMNDLLERNKKIKADADAAISAIMREAETHRERAGKIQAQLDAAYAERQRITQDAERRILTLKDETESLKDRLEAAVAELLHSEQWLEYLNTRIGAQLNDVLTRTDEFWTSRRAEQAP